MALSPLDRRILAAAAETMFPPGGAFEADGNEAAVVDYVDRYLGAMGWVDRLQIVAFLRVFDAAFALFAADPRARFHRADPTSRREYLSSWETHPSYGRRMGFQALRMVLTFAYLEAPAVKVAMGVTPPEPPEGDLETELHHLARTARAVAAEIR